MESVSEHLFRRGSRGTFYLRRRIPSHLRDCYPRHKSEFVLSLRTSDERLAKERLRVELARQDEEFAARASRLQQQWNPPPRQTLHLLSDAQIKSLADTWIHSVLHADEQARRHGLTDEDFDELDTRIAGQRAELGRLLARGNVQPILPAFRTFLHVCGFDSKLTPDDERQGAFAFLQAVVTALDYQAQRQDGKPLPTASVIEAPPASPTWDAVFDTWRDYVVDRPKATTIASQTAWRQLRAFAATHGVLHPPAFGAAPAS